ncbi:MAG: hypothetical protein JWM11_6172 [Planctomycetaceae bacterium]|nr:hypothetical protein [Planctomycetaceae bacterium]
MLRSICIPLVFLALGMSVLVYAESGPASREKASSAVPKELLEKKLEAARNVFRLNQDRLKSGQAACDVSFFMWSEHWLNAELALANNRVQRIAAFKAHLERSKDLENIAILRSKSGQGPEVDTLAATYYRTDAEIRLIQVSAE